MAKIKVLILAFILVIAFTLRFYKLDSIPNGYREDETSIGYNAYSIFKTGKDEHGRFLPQNFKAFGEYKLPGYIYATVPSVAIFGIDQFSVRLVSALSGFLTVFLAFFLTKQLLKHFKDVSRRTQEWLPIIVAGLLAVNPWLIFFSRSAFEVTLANLFILIGVFMFLKGLNEKRIFYFILTALFLALSVYTYNIARIFTPLLLLSFVLFFGEGNIKKKLKFYSPLLISFTILIIPFLYGAITKGGVDSTLGTFIFSSARIQSPLQEFRSYIFEFNPLIAKILFNTYAMTFWLYISNIFAHLSVSFYFLTGDIPGSSTIGTHGQFHLFELPMIVIGLILLYVNRSKATFLVFSWILSLVLVASLTRDPPQATRSFFILFPITLASAMGILYTYEKIYQLKSKVRVILFAAGTLLIGYSILYYLFSYFVRFPIYYASYWNFGDVEVGNFIKENQNGYDKVLVDKGASINYSIVISEMNYPPERFIKDAIWTADDTEGFSYPRSFGNIETRDIDWERDTELKNTIIITRPENIKGNVGILKTIKYPQRPVVFNRGQDIVRLPVEETAFVIIETKP